MLWITTDDNVMITVEQCLIQRFCSRKPYAWWMSIQPMVETQVAFSDNVNDKFWTLGVAVL